jgi:hypothetical protein
MVGPPSQGLFQYPQPVSEAHLAGATDGTVAAYDDVTLDRLWHFNLGSGINAPPMTF